ncbi:toxin CptA [Xenorhabdus cabanillasii]|uniref:Toxin CptA n=1 Tax=Xenorhabdus cabanillasii TaxID=351673 RepID=A0A3D9ULE3_9GAMM|nr:toxin CptA [Xenorhabdus cabanillasii]
MALWYGELRISLRTRLFSSGVHGVIALAALLAPWFANSFYVWLLPPIIISIVVSWIRSQRNIMQCRGKLILFRGNKVHWQKERWKITQPPWLSRYGIMLTLRTFEQAESFCLRPNIQLWVASDSMSVEAWRSFSQIMRSTELWKEKAERA